MLVAACVFGVAGLFWSRKKPVPSPAPTLQIDPIHGHLLYAQPKLRTIKVWLGDQELAAEIAREPVQIATGMMYRTNMPENEAMIFVFTNANWQKFYMRNCVVPLSAAYIDPTGVILQTIDMRPADEIGIPSQSGNVQFVLEVPKAGSRATTSAPARSCGRSAGHCEILFSNDSSRHGQPVHRPHVKRLFSHWSIARLSPCESESNSI